MFVDVPVDIMWLCANVYSDVWLPHGGKPHIASNNTSASSFEFVTVNIWDTLFLTVPQIAAVRC